MTAAVDMASRKSGRRANSRRYLRSNSSLDVANVDLALRRRRQFLEGSLWRATRLMPSPAPMIRNSEAEVSLAVGQRRLRHTRAAR